MATGTPGRESAPGLYRQASLTQIDPGAARRRWPGRTLAGHPTRRLGKALPRTPLSLESRPAMPRTPCRFFPGSGAAIRE